MNRESRRPGALIGGSILVAALSSACCWLPLLGMAFGISAVGAGAAFEDYRVPLLGMAAGLLVGAVFFQRRSRRACDSEGCPPPRGSGVLIPVVGGVLVLGFALFPELLARKPSAARSTVEAPRGPVSTYAVTGMTCEGCTDLLVGYLEEQPEVARAQVDYATATAQVEFVPGTPSPGSVMRRVADEWESYRFEPIDGGEAKVKLDDREPSSNVP